MELNRLFKTAGIATAALALTFLAGCSSSSTDATPTETPAATSADTAVPDVGMTGPIVVEPGTTTVDAKVGQTLDFKVDGDPGTWTTSVDNPEVLAISQGGKQGDAVMNPGAEALIVGTAKVTITNGTDTWDIAVNVA